LGFLWTKVELAVVYTTFFLHALYNRCFVTYSVA